MNDRVGDCLEGFSNRLWVNFN